MAFYPTYLYMKQHSVTGKLYFGKTILTHDKMLTYSGSGKIWNYHLRKHPGEVLTIWYCLFFDKDECMKTAIGLSEIANIVESTEWYNLKKETGIDGGPLPVHLREAAWKKTSATMTGKSKTPEHIANAALALTGRHHSEQHNATQSLVKKGIPWSSARREAQNKRKIA